MAEPKFFSAGRAIVKFAGIKIATLTNFSWQETVTNRPVRTIGSLEVREFVATAVDVSWSAGTVKTVSLDEVQQGLVGSRKPQDLIKREPFTIHVEDTAQTPPKVIETIEGCVCNGGSWNMPVGDIVTGTINGAGVRLKHESEK